MFFCRFCVGDKFYLCENKILCEYDYEERCVFASMALNPPATATLAHLKRQVTHVHPQVSAKLKKEEKKTPQEKINFLVCKK